MQSLFTDFSNPTKDQWKQKATTDLKGRPLESLTWMLTEGFSIGPYFTPEDNNESIGPLAAHPAGHIPGGDPRQWDNLQIVTVTDEKQANHLALLALNSGATGILFDLNLRQNSQPDMEVLLADIDLPHCIVAFKGCVQLPNLLTAYTAYASQQNVGPAQLHGFILCDLISQIAQTGIADHDGFRAWQNQRNKLVGYPNFSTLILDLAPFHNAGASAVQELAIALSIAATYADELTEAGVPASNIFEGMGVFMAVGNRYFLEIAKLQSLRYLLALLAQAYKLPNSRPSQFSIHVTSSRRELSVLDTNTNLLRHTTQAMSAILGGCNSLALDSFLVDEDTTLSRRMARNISTILHEEAYFGKVLNPVDGNYYLRNLQNQLVESAWKQFLIWEEAGGFRKLVESGQIMQEIDNARKLADDLVNKRREKIVGASAYADPANNLAEELPDIGDNGNFLSVHRSAAAFEGARQKAQQLATKIGQPLKALMLQFGQPEMYRARAAFAADFLKGGGWQIAESKPSNSPEALELDNFQLMVLCAADEDYNEQAKALADDLRANGYSGEIYVAGNPDALEQSVKGAALDGFINLKSDAPAIYNKLLNQVSLHHEA